MAVEQNRRAQVLDLSRPGAIEVEIDVSEAAEVLMSICALGDTDDYDTLDLGGDRLRAWRAELPAHLVEEADSLLLGSHKVAAHLLGIVLETPAPRTFAAFLERVAATDPLELKLHLFGRYGTAIGHLSSPDLIERAVRGDSVAKEEFLRSLADWSEKYELVLRLLDADGEELKAKLLALLPLWYEQVFEPHRREWRDAAEHDAEAKRALAQRHSPEQLVELATRGYQYTPAPGIRRIAFFPSWWMRPWVILWEHRGTKIFCYPITPPGEAGTSAAELARIYKALGDEGRLKLLRLLSDGPVKLSAAAAELGVAKSTAHHHLAILRQAGFVTIRDADENVYNLRRDLLPQAGDLLNAYLGAARSSATTA